MLKLLCGGTGSSGNSYTLDSESETLILDAGIPIKEIKRMCGWNIKKISGCVITHGHLDHSYSMKALEDIGVPVFAPHINQVPMVFGKEFRVQKFGLTDLSGNWVHTNANGEPCPIYGFLIEHPEMGRMLYITDCEFVKWRFKGVNHILLGVNYDSALLSGDDAKRNHVIRGHMSIDTACEFVKANASPDLQNVVMCHLSKENADANKFIEKMKAAVPGANVDVAETDKEWTLMKGDEPPF